MFQKNENETLGQYVARLRAQKGYSQRKLALVTGISNTTIGRIEKGETNNPDIPTLKLLAKHLNVDEMYMLKVAGYIESIDLQNYNTLGDETVDKITPESDAILTSFLKNKTFSSLLKGEMALSNDNIELFVQSLTKEEKFAILSAFIKTLNFNTVDGSYYADLKFPFARKQTVQQNKIVDTLSSRLRLLREEKNLTQVELAKDVGLSEVTYTQYELGKMEIDIQSLEKLANYFEVSTDYLLCRTDIRNAHESDHRITSDYIGERLGDKYKVVLDEAGYKFLQLYKNKIKDSIPDDELLNIVNSIIDLVNKQKNKDQDTN